MKGSWLERLGVGMRSGHEEVLQVPVEQILYNPYQPRKTFSEEELKDLAASIKTHGVLQPLLVRRLGAGYELIAGERRLRAARMAGLAEVPVIIREVSDRESGLLALVENLQREDLNFLEEAEGYRRLIQELGLTQEEVAHQVGKSQSAVANKIRLLKLSEEIRGIISREMISERHARTLLNLASIEEQRAVLEAIVAGQLTVAQTEVLVKERLKVGEEKTSPKKGGADRKKLPTGLLRDIRIFLNSFRQVTETLRASGVDARMVEEETEEFIAIHVRIPKEGGRSGQSPLRGGRAGGPGK
ncbi:MAG: ParB/RepB/Spo0J family partition protein [Firmicutes bacterium]|nr:ParB/RepB/Spo0J family partition protein [Bacillota bacterium]